MVRRFPLKLFLFCGLGAPLVAQDTGALIGTVFAAGTRRPLAGAHIAVPGQAELAVTSDSSGAFQLFHLPTGSVRVSVRLPRYAGLLETIPIGAGRVTVADFVLTPLEAVWDDVAAAERRRADGTKVETVAARDLEATGANSIGEALARHLPGAEVLWSSGQVGAGASIVLRGLKSFRHASQPVVYLDGVRLASTSGPGVSDARLSPLDLIDPATVAHIEVVRGPAALQYGAEASAGVIFVHTKKRR